jgi:hypothetical protein
VRSTASALVVTALSAIVLTGCFGGSSNHGTTTTTTEMPTTTTTTLAPPPPAASATGPLAVAAQIQVPGNASNPPILTEAPDGAIFGANFSTGGTDNVWVIDGTNAASTAETITTGVSGLAADNSTLFVAGYAYATAYDRATGAQTMQWTLPPVNSANSSNDHLVSLTVGGSNLYVLIVDGNNTDVYRIDPTSSAPPVLLVSSPAGATIGPDGSVYYEGATNDLEQLSPSGVTTTGPELSHSPNGLGGGVQYLLTVVGADVWAFEPAGQGLDASFSEYDGTTLAALGTVGASVADESLAATMAGPLVGLGSEQGCNCVARFTLSDTSADSLVVGQVSGGPIGPYPAVLIDKSNLLYIDRLS